MNNPNEYDEYERRIREAELETSKEKIQTIQQEVMMNSQEKSMITEQLSLGDELERIDYLLRGWTLIVNEDTGESRWGKPPSNDLVVLSDYGVHLIRNTIAWYLNKNTLLSNYEDDVILNKMEDFASDLNDTIFMEYEKVFQYPTLDDCRLVLTDRLRKKKELLVYAQDIMGKKVNEIEIEDQIMRDIEPIIQRELDKIREQIMKNKLKRYLILIREVQDAVHSTYLRAWKGIERKSLREHAHISETRGGIPMARSSALSSLMDKIRRK